MPDLPNAESVLPPGWASVKLSELGAAGRPAVKAGPFGSSLKKSYYVPQGYRVYGQEQVIAEDMSIGDYYIDEGRFQKLAANEVLPGDILISLVGTYGRLLVVPVGVERGIINPRLLRLALDPRAINPRYFKCWFNSPPIQRALDQSAHGGTMGILNASKLKPLSVRLPPLPEQRRIVAKIDALQERSAAAKEALDAIPPFLEKFRQSVLAAAFRGDLTKQWRVENPDVEPAPDLLERIRVERKQRWADRWPNKKYTPPKFAGDEGSDSVFGNSDETGWASAPLLELACPVRGIPYGIVKTGEPTPGGVPTVRCGDVRRFGVRGGQLKLVAHGISDKYQRTVLEGDEVLVAIRGTVGATAVALSSMAGFNISREVAMVPPVPGVNARYLMYALASPAGQALMRAQVKGVAQSGINLRDLRCLCMPLPPHEEQREVVRSVEDLLAVASSVEEAHRTIRQGHDGLEPSILAKAFRGELVPQDPTDEPASVLLKRIKAERAAAEPSKKKRKPKARR